MYAGGGLPALKIGKRMAHGLEFACESGSKWHNDRGSGGCRVRAEFWVCDGRDRHLTWWPFRQASKEVLREHLAGGTAGPRAGAQAQEGWTQGDGRWAGQWCVWGTEPNPVEGLCPELEVIKGLTRKTEGESGVTGEIRDVDTGGHWDPSV